MGISLNTQENRNLSYIENAKEILRIVGVRFFSFFFRHESLFLMFSREKNKYLEYAKDLQHFTSDVINQRMLSFDKEKDETTGKNEYGMKNKTTLMDIMLNELALGKIDYEGVREEIDTFMVAVSNLLLHEKHEWETFFYCRATKHLLDC